MRMMVCDRCGEIMKPFAACGTDMRVPKTAGDGRVTCYVMKHFDLCAACAEKIRKIIGGAVETGEGYTGEKPPAPEQENQEGATVPWNAQEMADRWTAVLDADGRTERVNDIPNVTAEEREG